MPPTAALRPVGCFFEWATRSGTLRAGSFGLMISTYGNVASCATGWKSRNGSNGSFLRVLGLTAMFAALISTV